MSGTASPRSGRPLTTSYVDLMKPDEDWRNLPDAAERRKIQNRLAQRAYRRNMRDRTKEVERLKKQLQQLQEAMCQDPTTTPPPEHELPSGGGSPSNLGDVHAQAAESTAQAHRRGMSDYIQQWSHAAPAEQVHGLGLTAADGETPLNFDSSCYFTHIPPATNDMVNTPSRRPRAITANVTSGNVNHPHHLRSSSIGPVYTSACSSPMPWAVAPATPDAADAMHISSHNFPMYNNGEELSMYHPESNYSLEEGVTSTPAYATSPESDLHSPAWSHLDRKASTRPTSSSLASTLLSSVPDVPEMQGASLPETTAPLLHFAVAGGHIDTLRLLLQRYDVNVNSRDSSGYTALQRAVMCGRTDMAALLLERGAVIDSDDSWTADMIKKSQS